MPLGVGAPKEQKQNNLRKVLQQYELYHRQL